MHWHNIHKYHLQTDSTCYLKIPGIQWFPELQLQAVALTLLGGAFLLGAAIVLAIFLEAAGEFFNLKLRKFDTIWCLNGHAGR